MRNVLLACCMTAVCLAPPKAVRADWVGFWKRFNVDCHRMKCWPEPFVQTDRQLSREPFLIMMDNGWRSQNTIGDYLFSPETQRLTTAGELRVRWILSEAPTHRRTVYVLRGLTPEATAIRLDAVQQFVVQVLPDGPLPPVLLTEVAPRGGSGDYFEHIERTYRSSLPAPRLPDVDTEGEN